MNNIRIGTRGSALALWQANFVQNTLEKYYPDIPVGQIVIKTEGDRDQSSSLSRIGGQGVFTKTIEDALLENRIDVAVHSLKDLPSAMTAGLELAAVPERGPVEDVLVSGDGRTLEDLQEGAAIATGSIRRQSQLLHLRPDLQIADLRGNIDTRLRKLREQNLDGIVMARAALVRLKKNDVKHYVFPPEQMIPGVSQGALGIQIRQGEDELHALLQKLNHEPSMNAAIAERAFLHTLDSGCQFPVGAWARPEEGNMLVIEGFVGSLDGRTVIREKRRGRVEDAQQTGHQLALDFLERGAGRILEELT